MHNLKEIRKDFVAFEKALKKRSVDIDYKKLKDLDIQNRDFIQKKEALEKEKKDISKSKDKSLFLKSKEISESIDKISEKQKKHSSSNLSGHSKQSLSKVSVFRWFQLFLCQVK